MYPYWSDPYWGYYQDPNSYQEEPPIPQEEPPLPQKEPNNMKETKETSNTSEEDYYAAQMPYWDPYYAYYAAYYGYYPPPQPPQPYSPHAFYHSTETDDYSSTDEMTYYGARFPRGPTPLDYNHLMALNGDQITPTDTEVESINSEKEEQDNVKLPTIRSVSDIQVYNENTTDEQSSITTEEEDDEMSDSSESQEEEEDSGSTEGGEQGHLPHQLSVIFEENEVSESHRSKREASVATTLSEDDSSTTIEGGHETEESCDEDLGEATVIVRLPLTLKFGMSKDGMEGVTELIVGDSEMKPGTPETNSVNYIRSPLHRQHSNETIENYETAEESDADSRNNSPIKSFDVNSEPVDEEDTDFWNEINKTARSDDENNCHSLLNDDCSGDADISDEENVTQIEINRQTENSNEDNIDDDVEDSGDDTTDSEDDNSVEDADDFKLEKDLRDAFASEAVKERVRALREAGKLFIGADSKEETISVRQRIMAFENGESTNATASRSSSMKGCDLSEEDGDSGVTSDVSRHTDTESESTPDRMKHRYERAATHSRLFKLLQDECAKSDDEEEDENDGERMELRKKNLSLALSNSEPESGICSPASPTWLAKELVHELLDGRRGRKYKSLPLKKLYAVAQRILQEDTRCSISEDGCPLQVSYALEYNNYYNSFEEASALKRRIARCPRVKSEKNVPVHLLSNTPSSNHDKSRPTSPSRLPQQVTSAS